MTSLKNTSNQSQRLWSAHTNPLTLFGGVVLTTPPIFELTNHSPPFSHVIFSLDQSERSIFPLANQKPDQRVSSSCAYHYYQFLAKYSNRLTDKPLRKHFRVKLDLDGVRKARYPRITKRATKRVSGLSCFCDQSQEAFVNLRLFQRTANL